MYRRGGQVLSVTTVAASTVTAANMPATGMNTAVHVAIAAAAGLAVWAGIYVVGALIKR